MPHLGLSHSSRLLLTFRLLIQILTNLLLGSMISDDQTPTNRSKIWDQWTWTAVTEDRLCYIFCSVAIDFDAVRRRFGWGSENPYFRYSVSISCQTVWHGRDLPTCCWELFSHCKNIQKETRPHLLRLFYNKQGFEIVTKSCEMSVKESFLFAILWLNVAELILGSIESEMTQPYLTYFRVSP